jgi:hypothetical protein
MVAHRATRSPARCGGMQRRSSRRATTSKLDRLVFSLSHVWRGEAVLRIGRRGGRSRQRQRCVLPRSPTRCCDRSVGAVMRSGRRAAAEEWTRWTMEILAEQRSTGGAPRRTCRSSTFITLKWWGDRSRYDISRAARAAGDVHRRLGVSPGARARSRARNALRSGVRETGGRPRPAARSDRREVRAAGTPSSSRTRSRPMQPGTRRTRS